MLPFSLSRVCVVVFVSWRQAHHEGLRSPLLIWSILKNFYCRKPPLLEKRKTALPPCVFFLPSSLSVSLSTRLVLLSSLFISSCLAAAPSKTQRPFSNVVPLSLSLHWARLSFQTFAGSFAALLLWSLHLMILQYVCICVRVCMSVCVSR